MHPVRRARIRAKRARIFEFRNCAFRNLRIFAQKRAPPGGYSCLERPPYLLNTPWGVGECLVAVGCPVGHRHGCTQVRCARVSRAFSAYIQRAIRTIRDVTTDAHGTNTTIKSIPNPPQ
eukprot:4626213-Prymnesium_polylepis.3